MNKKGGLQAFVTSTFIFAFIILILFLIFGAGGGFKTTWNIGSFVAKVPVWVWVGIALLYLFSQMRGK